MSIRHLDATSLNNIWGGISDDLIKELYAFLNNGDYFARPVSCEEFVVRFKNTPGMDRILEVPSFRSGVLSTFEKPIVVRFAGSLGIYITGKFISGVAQFLQHRATRGNNN